MVVLVLLAALLPGRPAEARTGGPAIRCPDMAEPADAALARLRAAAAGALSVLPVEGSGAPTLGQLNILPANTDVRLVLPAADTGWQTEDPAVAVAIPKDAAGDKARGLTVVAASRAPDNALHLRVRLSEPLGGGFWTPHDLLVFGCTPGSPEIAFLARTRIAVSTLWPAAGAAIGAVLLLYLAADAAAARRLGKISLDPVQITAGVDGRGSISKLQILFFTLIVAGMLIYVLLRVGRLGDLSADVLLLLGISGVGGAAVKQASVLRRRVSAENWSWLKRQGWAAPPVQASWGDLVMEGTEFDVYRFQILIFSLIVGGALLFTGLFGLANFELPPALLGLLGLSQVVYLGGKVVSRPETVELNKAITNLRTRAGEVADKARGAAGGYDYSAIGETASLESAAGDVEHLTRTVFGGAVPGLRARKAHELV
ncbi:hypothetical protein CKO28_03815 [Rhodovibrio sodomensis]|uniref:Uncharacterized protein n=1 Tax=Rhodovibrio sodomensis TaxID=1088 RepID=A0ABS1D9W3_9PROT|nr:hypothetical protein [Rhodovibrio sodomensis]